MRVFVTGATGLIGRELLHQLSTQGYQINALYRSEEKRRDLLHLPVHWIKGSVEDATSLQTGMQDCDALIHAAAFAGIYAPVQQIMAVNYHGTRLVFDMARQQAIKKIVYVSSAGVFGPSGNGITDETSVNGSFYATPYDKIKALTEDLALEFARKGLPVVIVNPTRLYGPGLMNEANSVTLLIQKYLRGQWKFIPGNGKAIGNYVFISDVAQGIQLALEKGKPGEKYILGGENISFNDFFEMLGKISGRNHPMIHIPYPVMMSVSSLLLAWAVITRTRPPITPGLIRKYVQNWNVSSSKAIRELGYQPISLEEGLHLTINWLKNPSTYA